MTDTANASPRPWSLFVHEEQEGGDGEVSICTEGEWIATMNLRRSTAKADAELIVYAVNNGPMLNILKADLADANKDIDLLREERDRLRDIVRRLVNEMHHCHRDLAGEMSQKLMDAIYEARDVIEEGGAE